MPSAWNIEFIIPLLRYVVDGDKADIILCQVRAFNPWSLGVEKNIGFLCTIYMPPGKVKHYLGRTEQYFPNKKYLFFVMVLNGSVLWCRA